MAARLLRLPLLLRPLCVISGLARKVIRDRLDLLVCPAATAGNVTCKRLCSICRWRAAHLMSLACASSTDTMCDLTRREESPEFNTIISLDHKVCTMVTQALVGDFMQADDTSVLFQQLLLIRRECTIDPQLTPFFVFAVLYASAKFKIDLCVVSLPGLADRLLQLHKRIFYILSIYLVEIATELYGRACPFNVNHRLPSYGKRRNAVMRVLPAVLREIASGAPSSADHETLHAWWQVGPAAKPWSSGLSNRLKGEIGAISYIRVQRGREFPLPVWHADTPPTGGLQSRKAWISPVASMQAIAIRMCGTLPSCVQMHPQVPRLLQQMNSWSLTMRRMGDNQFGHLCPRYLCLRCMTMDPTIVFDSRGVVFCRDCTFSNVVWINPIHMVVRLFHAREPKLQVGRMTCVVNGHGLRQADVCKSVLDGRVICAEHSEQYPWLVLVDPASATQVANLLRPRKRVFKPSSRPHRSRPSLGSAHV